MIHQLNSTLLHHLVFEFGSHILLSFCVTEIVFKGLKIVGGHASPLLINQLCAFVVKLRKDSIADTIGRLQLYDEVVKWNGKLLRGLTFDEVYSIITKTQLNC